jgi:peptidoglycan hydrolase-like protein with peptidoglycan-binding domain
MRFNRCLLAVTAVMTVSGISYAQSSGTAFVVAPGLLVTNHHVIDGCGAIDVVAADGRRPATVVDSVEQIDLALLRVYGLRGGVASLRTKSATLLGESATVFGFPLGGALSSTGNFTTGVVSSLRGLRDAAGEIQITAPVQPGNSGGPVLDRAGSVIGVVQGKLDALRAVRATGDIPQNVNFAVSLDVLADFLEKNNVQFKSAERQPAIETTQVAEMAQSFTYKISCTRTSRTATAPRPQNPLPAAPTPDKLVQDIQTALNQKGFNAGPADGFLGPQTQTAIVRAQKSLGLVANGLPNQALLAAIGSLSNSTVNRERPIINSEISCNNLDSQLISSRIKSYMRSTATQAEILGWTHPGNGVTLQNPTSTWQFFIGTSGTPYSLKLISSSGSSAFDSAIRFAIYNVVACIPDSNSSHRPLTVTYKLY